MALRSRSVTGDDRPPASALERARAEHWLRYAATFFAVAVLIHNSDHLRRGRDSVGSDVLWAGSSAIVLEVAIVVLVFMRHRLAPLAASAGGFALAPGYLFVHFTPARSWLSDSFTSGDASAVSIGAAGLEVVAALTLGVAGALMLRREGRAAPLIGSTRGERGPSLAQALRQPVPAAMLLGNLVILVLTFA